MRLHLSAKQRTKKNVDIKRMISHRAKLNGKALTAKKITLRHRIQGRCQTIDVVFIIARFAKQEIGVIRVTTAHLAPLVKVGSSSVFPRAHYGMIIWRRMDLFFRGWHDNFWDRHRFHIDWRRPRLEARL
jgi:hypothetical protein